MDEQEIPAASNDRSTGRFMVGALLVAAGAALLIERLGAMPPAWRDRIWPCLLIGYGVARLLQPRAQGREGLFFVLAGGWWLAESPAGCRWSAPGRCSSSRSASASCSSRSRPVTATPTACR